MEFIISYFEFENLMTKMNDAKIWVKILLYKE